MEDWLKTQYPARIRSIIKYYTETSNVLRSNYKNRVLVVPYELLVSNPDFWLPEIFKHCNLKYRNEFKKLNKKINKLVHGKKIDTEYMYRYKGNLPSEICNDIMEKFNESQFAFEFDERPVYSNIIEQIKENDLEYLLPRVSVKKT